MGLRHPRRRDRLAVGVLDPPRPRLDVGAVHPEERERALERVHVARRGAAEALELGREGRRRLLVLGVERPRAERARVARDRLPQRGQRRLAGGVDEQRRRVVEELVADGARHRPVAQSLAGVEDLLHPHVGHAGLAQRREVAGGVDQPVGMVDPQAVDLPVGHQGEREPVGLLEHRGVLLAHARKVVDVEEAAVAPGVLVEVEEAPPARGVAPVRVGVVGRHVVRDDVEHDAQAGGARVRGQRVERVRAPQFLRDAGRVDDVVAVRRARPRLEGRRQVEVGDPEVAQVGHERPRLGEPEPGTELEAVGGARLGHRRATRRGAGGSPSARSRRPPRPRPARRRGPRGRRCSARASSGRRRSGSAA